jgi:hypothetical protein
LPDVVLELQPGVRYLELDWPVDELVKLFLSDHAPDRFHLEPAAVTVELKGARGTFHINRLDRGAFVFRSAIAGRISIGLAAERALDVDPDFDVRGALAALIAENLAVGVVSDRAGGDR